MAATQIDTGYIAGHLGLDQSVVTSLVTEPTVDLVATLLQAIAAKAHEFDTLYADKLQTDIELENAVRSSENRSQASKGTAEKALKDVEEARQKLKEEETKRQSIENELRVLKAKNSDHAAEVKSLNDKIETLQSSNRTNLSIIESNNKRDQTLTEELTKQHQRNVELAREVNALQQSEQNAKGQLNSAKYREDSLKQQLELACRNSEWLEQELKTKSEESLKSRKEKGARIAELERESEDARSQVDALKRSEQQLRERLDAMQTKADDALVKLQKQEGAFASTVESYKQELGDQRRLVDMSEQLSKKHQERVRDLEAEKERLKNNYENEIRRLRLELEQEHQTTAEMEERIRQLEAELDEVQARLEQGPPPQSAPQTPRANGSFMTRAASPFGTPASIRSKSVMTATQAIEQLYQVKGQLASEKRRNQQLSEELDNMIAALEAKAPEIQELQAESETLRNEIARMSELSQQSFEERALARKAARKAESALTTAQSEAKILRTQLRDLGTQIQMLVFNIYAIEKGMDQLTEEEKFRLQQLERGEITEEALSDLSDTHQFITRKLVVFKDVKSLQAKNEDLMRITRELAEQLESEEALAAKHQAKEDHDRVEKLQRDLEHMTEESRSIKNTMESYKMERDMFRRILQQRGAGVDEASMLRSSLDGSQRAPLASIEGGDQSESLSEALRKLQSEYDNFRDAQDGVRADMRNQVDRLSSEKNSLHAERVKLQGEVRLESERREMLQSNFVALQNENSELQRRIQALSETAVKQDIRTQQVAEELIETKGLLDSMRNETANLKAEKKLWRDIQDRMSKDNESLIEEKNRLNHLLATQQSLENERNMSESEARRKAQAKIETLERELSDTQRKLSNEADENKKLQLRKEFEAKESQKRIDELMSSLSQIREEHVSVRTTRDHLQARVDELTVELRNAEERVGRLQPRPTPRPGLGGDGNERQLELEAELHDLNNDMSDLKRDLDLANTQLENAKAQAEQYREISQGNEEALEDLRASQEQYRLEMESLIEEKDSKIKELSQRIEDMSEELSRTNTELSQLRDSQGEVARKYEDEKSILEDELKRLREDSARHAEATRYHQQDLRAQAEIASKAQQDYEKELVKHAEAAKLVQQLRTEYNALKSESASLRAEAESAKVTLAQSESSWEDRRQQLEQEMAELTTRREDVNAQNKLLHQQLEGLTAQVSALQQSRSGRHECGDEAMSPVNVVDALEGLRELNSYLRREKEILEVQYDLKSQESRRLQQQVEYTQSQLDEARLKLDQERAQSAQGGRTSMTHQDLMEKLNELNLYRESSAALRNENTQLKDQVSEKNRRIEEMEAKIQPLQAEIDTLGTQKSYLEEEIKQVQEDRDRWQKRTEGILTKYGRVDPAEMEQLKKNITDLEEERDTLREGQKPLQEKVTELESTLEYERQSWQTTRAKLVEQAKERSRMLRSEKGEAVQRANQLQEQLDKVTGDLQGAQKLAEDAGREKTELDEQIQSFKKQVDELRQQAQAQQAEQQPPTAPSETQPAEATASAEIVKQLEQQLTDIRMELEAVNAQKLGAEQQLEQLRTELRTAISERDAATQKLQNGEAADSSNAMTEHAETAAAASDAPNGVSAELMKSLEEKVAAAEAKAAEYEQKANEVESKIQQTIKERSDRMRDTLNNKLKDRRVKMEEEYKKKEDDMKLRLEQEKLIWQAEHAGEKSTSETQPPPSPAKPEEKQAQAPPPAAPATPSAAGGIAPDLSQLDDASIRQFLSTNATVKSIIAANIKKKLETENARVKAEFESKITSAREQAQLMESKKSTLRINMTENKLKSATAKLGVVEKAANETPQKPVVEVWEVAKVAQPPPAAPAPGTPAKGGVAAAAKQAPATPGAAQANPAAMTTPITPAVQQTAGTPAASKPAASAAAGPKASENPFTVKPGNAAKPDAPNPFATKAEQGQQGQQPQQPQPAQAAQPTQQAQQTPQSQQLHHGQQSQPARGSGIPMPRGGARGRGGAYVPPGQRAASGNQDGGTGLQAGRGRGGHRGGRGGMNPGATDFQPGSKRPRGDSEIGGGAKRARGAH
ncbi:hypothetical protein C2857_001955 [Epichloe festucae Fl1]|uniref:Filament-forming protein n=1 Tax=Epichloe festucae (strain Fl1) TaxID=877507 RepID=A0A7U3SMI3_EPIFF|nr:hypothetical protein C2857_001955 [Epichloe festucae Fl1]